MNVEIPLVTKVCQLRIASKYPTGNVNVGTSIFSRLLGFYPYVTILYVLFLKSKRISICLNLLHEGSGDPAKEVPNTNHVLSWTSSLCSIFCLLPAEGFGDKVKK